MKQHMVTSWKNIQKYPPVKYEHNNYTTTNCHTRTFPGYLTKIMCLAYACVPFGGNIKCFHQLSGSEIGQTGCCINCAREHELLINNGIAHLPAHCRVCTCAPRLWAIKILRRGNASTLWRKEGIVFFLPPKGTHAYAKPLTSLFSSREELVWGMLRWYNHYAHVSSLYCFLYIYIYKVNLLLHCVCLARILFWRPWRK